MQQRNRLAPPLLRAAGGG